MFWQWHHLRVSHPVWVRPGVVRTKQVLALNVSESHCDNTYDWIYVTKQFVRPRNKVGARIASICICFFWKNSCSGIQLKEAVSEPAMQPTLLLFKRMWCWLVSSLYFFFFLCSKQCCVAWFCAELCERRKQPHLLRYSSGMAGAECWLRVGGWVCGCGSVGFVIVYLAKPWQALASCVMLVFVCSCNVVASHHTLAVCAVGPSFVLESWSLAVVGTVTRGVGLFMRCCQAPLWMNVGHSCNLVCCIRFLLRCNFCFIVFRFMLFLLLWRWVVHWRLIYVQCPVVAW